MIHQELGLHRGGSFTFIIDHMQAGEALLRVVPCPTTARLGGLRRGVRHGVSGYVADCSLSDKQKIFFRFVKLPSQPCVNAAESRAY